MNISNKQFFGIGIATLGIVSALYALKLVSKVVLLSVFAAAGSFVAIVFLLKLAEFVTEFVAESRKKLAEGKQHGNKTAENGK